MPLVASLKRSHFTARTYHHESALPILAQLQFFSFSSKNIQGYYSLQKAT